MKTSLANFLKVVDEKHEINFRWPITEKSTGTCLLTKFTRTRNHIQITNDKKLPCLTKSQLA